MGPPRDLTHFFEFLAGKEATTKDVPNFFYRTHQGNTHSALDPNMQTAFEEKCARAKALAVKWCDSVVLCEENRFFDLCSAMEQCISTITESQDESHDIHDGSRFETQKRPPERSLKIETPRPDPIPEKTADLRTEDEPKQTPSLRDLERMVAAEVPLTLALLDDFSRVVIMSPSTMDVTFDVLPTRLDFENLKYVLEEEIARKATSAICHFCDCSRKEKNVRIKIAGCGVFCKDQLVIMTRFHERVQILKRVRSLCHWLSGLRWPKTSPRHFSDTFCDALFEEYASPEKMAQTMDILSTAPFAQPVTLQGTPRKCELRDILSLRNPEWLSDGAIAICADLIARSGKHVQFVEPTVWVTMDATRIRRMLPARRGVILLPLHVRRCHWVGIILDLDQNEIRRFDPLHSKRGLGALSRVTERLFSPVMNGRYAKMRIVDERDVQQPDGHNCGILVLLFFDKYVRGGPWASFSSGEMEFMRYRYVAEICHRYRNASQVSRYKSQDWSDEVRQNEQMAQRLQKERYRVFETERARKENDEMRIEEERQRMQEEETQQRHMDLMARRRLEEDERRRLEEADRRRQEDRNRKHLEEQARRSRHDEERKREEGIRRRQEEKIRLLNSVLSMAHDLQVTGRQHQDIPACRSSYCEILTLSGVEVTLSSPASTIRKAYRKLALALHPDKCTDVAIQATQAFQIVQEAYNGVGECSSDENFENTL